MLCPFMPVTHVMAVYSIEAGVHGNNAEPAAGPNDTIAQRQSRSMYLSILR